MNRNLFNTEVRPGLVTVPIGQQGIGFDRLDLDAWVDACKQRNERPRDLPGENQWVNETRQGSANEGTSGTSRKRSKGVRLFESTGESDRENAEMYLLKRIEEIRQVEVRVDS